MKKLLLGLVFVAWLAALSICLYWVVQPTQNAHVCRYQAVVIRTPGNFEAVRIFDCVTGNFVR